MTAHTHDLASHTGTARVRSRWLLPGLFIVVAASALVIAGVLSMSAVLYAGLLGSMILMHVGGHGGHRAHGGGHAAHGDSTQDTEDLSPDSSGSQAPGAGSDGKRDDRSSTNQGHAPLDSSRDPIPPMPSLSRAGRPGDRDLQHTS